MRRLLIFFVLLLILSQVSITPIDFSLLQKDTIHVSVQGEVVQETILEVPLYSTISDVLALVECTQESDLSSVNPLTILQEGDVLVIPKKSQEESVEKVSINFGSLQQLCTLPGIGESTANAIIAYREENGLFQTLEDLKNVKGIGEGKYEKILPYISL